MIGQEEDKEMLEGTEKTRFTPNFSSLDRSDVQHVAKATCTKKANAKRGSWKKLKKACGHLRRRGENVTWVMRAWKHDGVA